jgi:hypothetical protein
VRHSSYKGIGVCMFECVEDVSARGDIESDARVRPAASVVAAVVHAAARTTKPSDGQVGTRKCVRVS